MLGVSNLHFSQGVFHSNISSAVMLWMSARYWQASNHVKSGALVRAWRIQLLSLSHLMAHILAGFCWGLCSVVNSGWQSQLHMHFNQPVPHHCILELLLWSIGGMPSSCTKSLSMHGPSFSVFMPYMLI